jgi:hypothetical protein
VCSALLSPANAASWSSPSAQNTQFSRRSAGGASASAMRRATTGISRLPRRALSSSSQEQTLDATESGLTANTTVSADAIKPARRSCHGSPGAISVLSRKASKPLAASAATSICANAKSLRE